MTGGASFLGFHHELFFQLEAEFFGRFHAELRVIRDVGFRIVAKIVDFFQWAKVLLRRAVAIEAPTHRKRADLVNDLHFVDVAVATLAGNPAIDVRGVVEIHVIGCFVHFDPLDRLAVVARVGRIHRFVKRSQFRAIPLHVLVAVPASAASRNIGNTGDIHERMTVAAVQTELIDVDFMGKRNRLRRLIPDILRLRCRVIRDSKGNARRYGPAADSDLERQ